MVRFFFGANRSGIATIPIPAAETRFFLMLPEDLEGNIRKRAQTISASGLVGNRLTQNHSSKVFSLFSFFFSLFSIFTYIYGTNNTHNDISK